MPDRQRPQSSTSNPARGAHRGRGGKPLLCVVVPVLNEAAGLHALLARLSPVLASLSDLDWQVLFIDDGSTDGTAAVLRDLNAKDARITAVTLSRNFGKEIAVAAGLAYSDSDAVVVMDADLQHPPELIPDLVAQWRAGYDVVYGERTDREVDGPIRKWFAKAYYAVFRLLSRTPLPDNAGDFRLLSRRAVDALNRLGERSRFNKGLYSWIGFRSIGVPFNVAGRSDHGRSRWKTRRLIRFAIDGLASFSTLPLRIWSLVGLGVSLFAFTFIIVFLIKTLIYGVDQAGFPSLILSIMLFSGIQLISLGIIGEYLGRIYEEVKARPLYLVSEEIGVSGVSRPDQPRRSDAVSAGGLIAHNDTADAPANDHADRPS